jgi:hypothetical protein
MLYAIAVRYHRYSAMYVYSITSGFEKRYSTTITRYLKRYILYFIKYFFNFNYYKYHTILIVFVRFES